MEAEMNAQPFYGLADYSSFPLSPPTDEDFAAFRDVYEEGTAVETDYRAPSPEPPEQKKRRRASVSPVSEEAWRGPASPESAYSEEPGGDGNGAGGTLKVTDAIDRIAAEGRFIKFEPESQVYVVLDGPGFEARFQQLRTVRAKRNEKAQARPFSKLHVHYILVRGDKWGKTGTAFKAKEAASEMHACDRVEASKVLVNLMPSDEAEAFQVTLQHFLNVIGAGDAFKQAKNGTAQTYNQQVDQHVYNQEGAHVREMYPPVSDPHAVGEAVYDMWHSGAKGDQGYWFQRAEGETAFENGAIVKLVDGRLRRDNFESAQSLYMAVSDLNVKWKGEPIPSPEQEKEGHWCCFLGQIPVTIRGAVKSGDHIGPALDGSGHGVVCEGQGPVIGIAMDGKTEQAAGVVKTMCFVGLNAMNDQIGTQIGSILEDAVKTRELVDELRQEMDRELEVAGRERRELEARVEVVEQMLHSGEEQEGERRGEWKDASDEASDVEHGGMWGVKEKENMWQQRWRLILVAVVVLVVAVAGLCAWLALGNSGKKVVVEQTVVEVITAPSAAKCTDHLSAAGCAKNETTCLWADLGELGHLCLDKPVSVDCAALETEDGCSTEGATKCTWLQGACYDTEEVEKVKCYLVNLVNAGVRGKMTRCTEFSTCEWTMQSASEGVCAVRDEFDPEKICDLPPELCAKDSRCTWYAGEQGSSCWRRVDVCSVATQEAECRLGNGCAWIAVPNLQQEGACVVLERCEGVQTRTGCVLLESTPLGCTWTVDGQREYCQTPERQAEFESLDSTVVNASRADDQPAGARG